MSNRYLIDKQMREVELVIEAWVEYKTGVEPFNPLQARTQSYSEPIGGGIMTSIVPCHAIDRESRHVPLMEHLMRQWPDDISDAVRLYYLDGQKLSKGQRQQAWSDKHRQSRHMYEAYLMVARWMIWSKLNP